MTEATCMGIIAMFGVIGFTYFIARVILESRVK